MGYEDDSTHDDVDEAFDRMDTNRDHVLSRDEFRNGMQPPHGGIDLKLLQTPPSQSLASGRSSEVPEPATGTPGRYIPAGMAQLCDDDDRAPVAWFVRMGSDRGSKTQRAKSNPVRPIQSADAAEKRMRGALQKPRWSQHLPSRAQDKR